MVCPDCEQRHSDAAVACIHCGRPNHLAVAVASPPVSTPSIPPPLPPTQPRSRHACPNCDFEHTQKLAVIYRDGYQVVDTGTAGVGVGFGGGVAVGGARTHGRAQSLSSKGAAPPQPKSDGASSWCAILAIVGLVAIMGGGLEAVPFTVAVWFGAGICGWISYGTREWNRDVFPALLERWKNTYRCGRCGHQYIVAATVSTRV